jgi:hypothetical protein
LLLRIFGDFFLYYWLVFNFFILNFLSIRGIIFNGGHLRTSGCHPSYIVKLPQLELGRVWSRFLLIHHWVVIVGRATFIANTCDAVKVVPI